METRRVQITGGSSYIITLPKEWIIKNNIQPKDQLNLIIQSDKSLLITPKNYKNYIYKEKIFNLDKIKKPEYLFRLLIGTYIMGYSAIILESKSRIKPEYRKIILDFVQSAIGLEIMDENPRIITIKDLINPTEMTFNKMTNRIFLLVKIMHEDALIALKNKNKELAKDIIKRDDEVDRLYWLIARHSNLVLRSYFIAREMNIDPEEANFYYLICRTIERIGDHVVNIAKNIPIIIDNGIDEEIIKKIIEAGKMAISFFTESVNVWNIKSLERANEIIENVEKLNKLCDEINNIVMKIKGPSAIAISYIVESIRRTADYSVNICELTINHLV